jgi:hypothetical protein
MAGENLILDGSTPIIYEWIMQLYKNHLAFKDYRLKDGGHAHRMF